MFKGHKKTLLPFFITILLCCVSASSFAHVKWFAPFDVAAEPRDIFTVMTPAFWLIGIGSILSVFVLSVFENLPVGKRFNVRMDHYRDVLMAHLPLDFCPRAIRYALLIFFTSIWAIGGIILTPELTYEDSIFIGAVHLMIIFSLFTEKSSRLAGIGILILWAYSAYYYGFFHASDYVIFLGLAVFLILNASQESQKTARGFLLLYIAISITLQWASVEKFVYPEWSFPILIERPHLTMGLGEENFMVLAGFAEFAFAFLLIAVGGISFVITTLTLAIIFILAIFDFGKIDAIGHLAIIASLLVMALYGPTSINKRLSRLHNNCWVNASIVSFIYCVSVIIFFVLYYSTRSAWMMTTIPSH